MMKKNILIILVIACAIGLLWSCKKDLELVGPVSNPEGMAFIKIVHAAPSFRQVFNGSDSFNVYANNNKLNGSFLTYNSAFPTATNLYAAVPAGPQSLRITVNGKLTPDSITLATINKTLDANSYYSFIITDEALTTNETRQMWLKDNFALTDTTQFSLRFVHAVLNDPGAVDVYSFQKGSNLFSNITPGTTTPFATLPYTLLSDTLYVRAAGTQTEIARFNVNSGAPLNRTRAYTLLYKGRFGVTGTKGRSLSVYTNN